MGTYLRCACKSFGARPKPERGQCLWRVTGVGGAAADEHRARAAALHAWHAWQAVEYLFKAERHSRQVPGQLDHGKLSLQKAWAVQSKWRGG